MSTEAGAPVCLGDIVTTAFSPGPRMIVVDLPHNSLDTHMLTAAWKDRAGKVYEAPFSPQDLALLERAKN